MATSRIPFRTPKHKFARELQQYLVHAHARIYDKSWKALRAEKPR